jgi:hypothetical protein
MYIRPGGLYLSVPAQREGQAVPLGAVARTAETHLITALERHGHARQDDPYFQCCMAHPLTELPQPDLAEGYRTRPVRGEEDLTDRVAVHRAAWHPSRVTEGGYRTVMAAWPYRADLDWVVEAPDGSLVANCLIWLDERNGVGELEPDSTGAPQPGRSRSVSLVDERGSVHDQYCSVPGGLLHRAGDAPGRHTGVRGVLTFADPEYD